jgi:hypothetical protein
VYRLTFSRSLAEIICRDTGLKLQRFNCIAGRILDVGELSKTGIYGVLSKNKGVLLRAPLIQQVAEMYRDNQYRDICEVYLEKV